MLFLRLKLVLLYTMVILFSTLRNAHNIWQPIEGTPYYSSFAIRDKLHSPLISILNCLAKRAYGFKSMLGGETINKYGDIKS
jgi:hypothetical protein